LGGVVKSSHHIDVHTHIYYLVFVPAFWFQVLAQPLAKKTAGLIEQET
jgi:hypothetical protein